MLVNPTFTVHWYYNSSFTVHWYYNSSFSSAAFLEI